MSELLPRSHATAASWRVQVTVSAALLAVWLGADSVGVLGTGLRATLMWSGLLVAVATSVPAAATQWLMLAAYVGGLAAVGGLVWGEPALLVAGILAILSTGRRGGDRQVLTAVAVGILGFGLFRLVVRTSPLAWTFSDAVGAALGHATTYLTDQPLEIGSSFAGLDFLVLMGWLTACWSAYSDRPWQVALWGTGAILVGHFLYLCLLSWTPAALHLLPQPFLPEFGNPYVPPPFQWADLFRQWLPWNLPLLAAVIHVLIAIGIMNWTTWQEPNDPSPVEFNPGSPGARRARLLRVYVPCALAVLIPVVGALVVPRRHLEGKTIVAYEYGHLDWAAPQYDAYGRESAGMYGLLPTYVQGLGGQFYVSPELAAVDLEGVDVLLLLNPNQTLTPEMQTRVWEYVKSGGSLLVVTNGYDPQPGQRDTTPELLEPASLVVNQDAAVSATGNWQAAEFWLAHPVAAALGQRPLPAWADTGASLASSWRVQPLLVGRWGWSAPQQGTAWDGQQQFASGQKLGDLILAGEQRLGRGRIMVLGSGVDWTNEGLVHGWQVVGGVLNYLATDSSNLLAAARQWFVLVAGLVLAWLVFRRPAPQTLMAVSVLLCVTSSAVRTISHRAMSVVPEGDWVASTDQQAGRGNRLAYLDGAHLNAFSWEDWGYDGLNGLALTLMRSGYLPLMATELDRPQLERAGMLVVTAPARSCSRRQRALVVDFVRRGGILIWIAGAEQAAASAGVLADFDLHLPRSPVPTTSSEREPEPMGRFRTPYLTSRQPDGGAYRVDVLFYAGWPVELVGGGGEVLATDPKGRAIIVRRNVGRGTVVLIGDTWFAANKNLEYAGGEPFVGRYENAHFWRWLISRLAAQDTWIPPVPPPPPAKAATESPSDEEAPLEMEGDL